jgi:thiosulfate reductase cytochrome b subunit
MFTGFEIHGSFTFFGFRDAVRYHNVAAYMLIVLIVFAIFWHFTTGEWKQYIPTKKFIKEQLNYYIFGIFKNLPHPTKKTTLSKLNPLQKLVYFFLKIVLFPTTVVTGVFYMMYRYPSRYGIESINVSSLECIAILHTLSAYFFVAFLIAHLYLITTGQTLTSNLKAMITGYEEIEEENKNEKK